MTQPDYEQIARDLWADFDELIDLSSAYPNLSVKSRAIGVKKATLACIQMMLLEFNDMRKILDNEELANEVEAKYRFWRNINKEMLKL
jgi:hypothetical protein